MDECIWGISPYVKSFFPVTFKSKFVHFLLLNTYRIVPDIYNFKGITKYSNEVFSKIQNNQKKATKYIVTLRILTVQLK